MAEKYVTCQVIKGFLLFTFPMSYFISSTFHSPLQHLPFATKQNLAHYHLHGPLRDNHYHANGQDTLNTQTDNHSIDRQNAGQIQEVTAHAKRAEILCIFKGNAIRREMMTQAMDILEKRQPTHSKDTNKM